jgi:hypothetical protein
MTTANDQLSQKITITNVIKELSSQLDIREDLIYSSNGVLLEARAYVHNKFEHPTTEEKK